MSNVLVANSDGPEQMSGSADRLSVEGFFEQYPGSVVLERVVDDDRQDSFSIHEARLISGDEGDRIAVIDSGKLYSYRDMPTLTEPYAGKYKKIPRISGIVEGLVDGPLSGFANRLGFEYHTVMSGNSIMPSGLALYPTPESLSETLKLDVGTPNPSVFMQLEFVEPQDTSNNNLTGEQIITALKDRRVLVSSSHDIKDHMTGCAIVASLPKTSEFVQGVAELEFSYGHDWSVLPGVNYSSASNFLFAWDLFTGYLSYYARGADSPADETIRNFITDLSYFPSGSDRDLTHSDLAELNEVRIREFTDEFRAFEAAQKDKG